MMQNNLKNQKICILYRDHLNNTWTKNRFEKIKKDLLKFENVETHHHNYDINFPFKLNKDVYHASSVIMNNPEIFVLDYYKRYPNFDLYFHMDYDVYFHGDISIFFENICQIPFDFLSSYICTKESFLSKFGCENMWIPKHNHFPIEYITHVCFFPFNGYSKQFLKFVYEYYDKFSIPGFCEVSLPTLSFNNSFITFDLENTSYINHDYFSGKSTSIFRENKLHHHVKHSI